MSFSIIAAVGKNREIGKKNQLIWRIPEDMNFFKKTTMGHPILMGRKTFESLPRLLPGRKHYVFSRKSIKNPSGNPIYLQDLAQFAHAYQNDAEEIFVIGGETIYRQMLDYADTLYLTEIEAVDKDADAFFPEFDKTRYNKQILGQGEDNGLKYTFSRYQLK